MQNQNFTVALVDKSLNLFKRKETGQPQRIYPIIEHDSRLDEISVDCHFYIDEEMYLALGCKGVSWKYTKVFVKNVEEFTNGKYHKFFDIEDLSEHIRAYNKFDKNKPLFLMGGEEFTKTAMKFSSKLLLTTIDEDFEGAYEKFPLDEAKTIFRGRKKIEPSLLREIRKYKRELRHKREQEFEIATNGMKIRKEPQAPQYTEDVLNTPDYMFYEFRR